MKFASKTLGGRHSLRQSEVPVVVDKAFCPPQRPPILRSERSKCETPIAAQDQLFELGRVVYLNVVVDISVDRQKRT